MVKNRVGKQKPQYEFQQREFNIGEHRRRIGLWSPRDQREGPEELGHNHLRRRFCMAADSL